MKKIFEEAKSRLKVKGKKLYKMKVAMISIKYYNKKKSEKNYCLCISYQILLIA